MRERDGAGGQVEVRPSWSAAEWVQICRAAGAVDVAPARWASDVLAGVLEVGPAPQRCTSRAVLWRHLLERWQSVFWACVALQAQVPAGRWDPVADLVARSGVLIGEQADQVAELERRRAGEVLAAVAGMVDMLGPGTRRSAAAIPHPELPKGSGHRAKLLLTTQTHEALARTSGLGGWTVSDYAGAATATAAALMMLDPAAAAETALLQRCHEQVQATAARLASQLTSGQPLTEDVWDRVTADLAHAEELLGQAHAARVSASPVDVRAAIPGVFLILGWAARWAVNAP